MLCVEYIVLVVFFFFFFMLRLPPRSTQSRSSAASDVYKRQVPADIVLHKELRRALCAPAHEFLDT